MLAPLATDWVLPMLQARVVYVAMAVHPLSNLALDNNWINCKQCQRWKYLLNQLAPLNYSA